MHGKHVLISGLFLLILSLPIQGFILVEPKASDSYPVHNLDTGLNYTAIQDAIDAPETLDGHTIFVEDGTYYENVYLNKTVTLIGENREATLINGSGVGNTMHVIANNVTVGNFTITGSEPGLQRTYGIYVNSSNNVFFNNIIAENNYGIGLDKAHNNTVDSNLIIDNLSGHYMENSNNNTFKRNILRDNGIGFYSLYSDCNVFDGNIAENVSEAILILHSNLCTFKRNTLIDNAIGFCIEQISGCLFLENSVVDSRQVGIRCYGYSFDNAIICNNITGNKEGLFFHDTSRTKILGNTFSKNNKGIAIYGGSSIAVSLEIKYNNIINNTIGIWNSEVLQPDCALICQNNFINNSVQTEMVDQAILLWNADYPSGGNYWDDYVGKASDTFSGSFQNETGNDGIGDTPYFVDAKNKDNYPLTGMFSTFNTSYGYAVDFVSNSSISDITLGIDTYEQEAILAFNVSGDSATDGFLRVCIPKFLINSSYIIMFDDEIITNTTFPQIRELPCSDETCTYFYITYTHSEHKIEIRGTTIVPEFPSFLVPLLFMLATILSAIVYKRKHAT